MNDAKQGKSAERLDALNVKLQGVENYLLHRALDRSRGELENAVDFINQAAKDGAIAIEYEGDTQNANAEGGEPEGSASEETASE